MKTIKQSTIKSVVNMMLGLYCDEVMTTASKVESIKSFNDYCREHGFPMDSCTLTDKEKEQATAVVKKLAPAVDRLSNLIVKEGTIRHKAVDVEKRKAYAREYNKTHKYPYSAERRRRTYVKYHPDAKVIKRLTDEEKAAIHSMCEEGQSLSYMREQLNRPCKTIKKYIVANIQGYVFWTSKNKPVR